MPSSFILLRFEGGWTCDIPSKTSEPGMAMHTRNSSLLCLAVFFFSASPAQTKPEKKGEKKKGLRG